MADLRICVLYEYAVLVSQLVLPGHGWSSGFCPECDKDNMLPAKAPRAIGFAMVLRLRMLPAVVVRGICCPERQKTLPRGSFAQHRAKDHAVSHTRFSDEQSLRSQAATSPPADQTPDNAWDFQMKVGLNIFLDF